VLYHRGRPAYVGQAWQAHTQPDPAQRRQSWHVSHLWQCPQPRGTGGQHWQRLACQGSGASNANCPGIGALGGLQVVFARMVSPVW
jgi:hypothetical protein